MVPIQPLIYHISLGREDTEMAPTRHVDAVDMAEVEGLVNATDDDDDDWD